MKKRETRFIREGGTTILGKDKPSASASDKAEKPKAETKKTESTKKED